MLTLDLAGLLGTGDPSAWSRTATPLRHRFEPLRRRHQRMAAGAGRGPAPIPRSQPQRNRGPRFDVTGQGRPRYVASGVVDGWLLNQYSMSEYGTGWGSPRRWTPARRGAATSSPGRRAR